MTGRSDAPRPRTQEEHPRGYDYRRRFPNLREFAGGEGGAVYIADTPEGHFVITDAGTMADFLDEDDPVLFIRGFDSAAARDAFCAAWYGRLERRRHGHATTDGSDDQ